MTQMVATTKQIAFLFIVFLFVAYLYFVNNTDEYKNIHQEKIWIILQNTYLTTAKGSVSYSQINREVFQPHGFEIIRSERPIPLLRNLNSQTCSKIFSDWLEIALAYKPPVRPPRKLLRKLVPQFTMNGHSVVTKAYYNNMAVSKPKVWNQISAWLKQDPITFANYGVTGLSVVNAMKAINVTGLNGVVIGSEQPWVEVISLQNGATSLVTVEYQKTIILGMDKIRYIHPYEYAKNWKLHTKFDFAVSFSSIEHSGLQRYGDPRDPIGDIREVQKVRCMLNKGGIFFLGLPRGQDQLVYNAHRVYGRIRLAMIFHGFKLLHIFRNSGPQPHVLKEEDFSITDGLIQDTFVLRKL